MSTFDAYLARVREVVLRVEPEAEEGTSYGMPAWRLAGKPLLGLNEAKEHIGVYPFSPEVVDALRPRLEDFKLTKGGVQCTPDHPLPDDVIAEMVRLRRAEIVG